MKTRYTLEEHLELNITDDTMLLDTWRINKKRFASKLQATVQSFPTYSLHDVSHSNNVIDNIECLLGEAGINQLSLTDTWLTLHAALMHDWGMVLTDSQMRNAIKTKDFSEFIEKNYFSDDTDLSNAIKSIENVRTEQLMLTNAYSIRNSMTLILSEYFRKYHGDNSYSKIMDNIFGDYNLSYDLIQSRLLEILADIVLCHTRDINVVLKLPQQQKGQNKDLCHPRFIAILLRLGDLLDIENNRFNDTIFQTFFEKLPEKSMLHLKKHHSLKELLITDDEIAIKLDCPDTSTYRIARQTIDWLKNDLDFFALNWNIIIPRDYNGHVPVVTRREVLINGEDVGHLQLSFSKEQIHNMLEGYNLYSEQFVCLREVIQNAIDATKIQIYRDIINEKYGNDIEKLLCSPYELFLNQIFEQYPIYIDIKIERLETDKIKIFFEICDLGIGINEEALLNISNVCVSYKNRKNVKEEYLQMPKWLRPTGGFGIGIQSVFTVTDILQIISKAEDEKAGKSIEITPMKYGGYISVTINKMKKKRGTEIKFNFIIEKDELDYAMERKFVIDKLDYESEEQRYNDYFECFIIEKFSNNLIPLYFNGKALGERMNINTSEIYYLNNDLIYQYCNEDKSKGFKIWDKSNNILINFQNISSTKPFNHISYRGVKLDDEMGYFEDEMNLELDIYGEDVQDCLVYSRNKFNYLYKKKYEFLCRDLPKKVTEVYIDILERGLGSKSEWEVIYVYLLAIKYDLNFKYKEIKVSLPIYELKNENYSLEHIDLMGYAELLRKEFVMMLPEKERYLGYEEVENNNFLDGFIKNPSDVLNGENISDKPQYIICDSCFSAIISEICSVISEDKYEKFRLLKCNIADKNKRLYIKCTVEEFYDSFLHPSEFAFRCVPAIELERFSMLEIVYHKWLGNNFCYYQMISPLKEDDIQMISCYTKEEFVNKIIYKSSFDNIVNKVYDKQKEADKYNHENIRNGYQVLIGELYDYFSTKDAK